MTTAAERIEIEAWRDLYEAVPPPLAARLGAFAGSYPGGALVLLAPGVPSVLFNRAIGLGTAGPVERDEVDAVVTKLEAHVPRYIVHVAPGAQPGALTTWLEARGLERYRRSWVKLERDAHAAPELSTSLAVRRPAAKHRQEFAQVLTRGFELPDAAGAFFASIVERERWHAFAAFAGDRPVAAAALFVADDVGYLAFAATLPEYRKRGAQGALMARRIQLALSLGCRLLVTETGEDTPDDPQHSYKNMLRCGFRPAGVRYNYVPRGLRLTRAAAAVAAP